MYGSIDHPSVLLDFDPMPTEKIQQKINQYILPYHKTQGFYQQNMEKHIDFNEQNNVASWGRLKTYVLHTDRRKKEAVGRLYDSIKSYTDKPEPVVIPKPIVKVKGDHFQLNSRAAGKRSANIKSKSM